MASGQNGTRRSAPVDEMPEDFAAPDYADQPPMDEFDYRLMAAKMAEARKGRRANPFRQYEYISAADLDGVTFSLDDLGITETQFGRTFKATVILPSGELRTLLLSANKRDELVEWWAENGCPKIDGLTVKTKPTKNGKPFYLLAQTE